MVALAQNPAGTNVNFDYFGRYPGLVAEMECVSGPRMVMVSVAHYPELTKASFEPSGLLLGVVVGSKSAFRPAWSKSQS
jgi:hypothetical protein